MCPHVTQCSFMAWIFMRLKQRMLALGFCFLLLWPHLPMCYQRTQAGEQVRKSIMTSFKFCLSHLVRLIAGRPERTCWAAIFLKPFYSLSSVLQAPRGQETSGEDKAKHKDDLPSELSSPAFPDSILSAFSSLGRQAPRPSKDLVWHQRPPIESHCCCASALTCWGCHCHLRNTQ